MLVEEGLPADCDTRGWLFLDVGSCVISVDKQLALIMNFRDDENLTEDVTLYDEDVSRESARFSIDSRQECVVAPRDSRQFGLCPECLHFTQPSVCR